MLFTIGRTMVAVLFILSGALQLLNFGETANEIASKVTLPEALSAVATFLSPYVEQLSRATGMSVAQLLAIAAAVLQIFCGLMIAFNFGARFFAAILVAFVIATTLFMHDFWNQVAVRDRNEGIVHILKNVALLGALFMVMGTKSMTSRSEAIYRDEDRI
jgi:putative oxidoreductase